MNRNEASKYTKDLLTKNGLINWHVRLTTDLTKPFLGMCSYRDKAIILNAHHIDTHGELEVLNTIRHEVAHALTPGMGHNELWAAKARELGCDNTSECASYSFSPSVIDAIRSGAEIEITYEEEIIRKPVYKVNKLVDKCAQCGKVAKEKDRYEAGNSVFIILECGHLTVKNIGTTSPFERITFDGDSTCQHNWNKTVCVKCNAKRLFPYQIEGCKALERANGRMAIFDEMGLGKTIQALGYLKFHPEQYPYLWVTKSGIKYQHAREIVRVLGKEHFPLIIRNSKDHFLPGVSGYVMSYDLFRNMPYEKIELAGIKSIILDECQAIKNPDSSRTRSLQRVVKNIPAIIPLSGTPWKNRGSEFFVVLNMLDPMRFHSFEGFKRTWVDTIWDGAKMIEGGISNPKKFKEHIADIAIRRERAEVMPELPLISRLKLIVEVPEHARKAYEAERQKLKDFMKDAIIDGEEDSLATHRQMMESIIIMRQIIGLAKMPSTIEWLEEFLEETDRKIVCFVHHKRCGEEIFKKMSDWCFENGYAQPLQLTSEKSPEERIHIQDLFNGSKHRLLVASTLASGEGLNLQTCSDCILHERQWNPQNEEQAEGRFIRIGQKANAVNATYVHGDNTIDTVLDSIVERKRIAFHNSMNKGEMATWNEQSLVKELVNALVA